MLKKSAGGVLAGTDTSSRHWALTGHRPLTKTPPPHHLGGVHKRAMPYSAWREPRGAHGVTLFIHRAMRLIILRVADLVDTVLRG